MAADVRARPSSASFTGGGIPLGWLPVAVPFYLVRQMVQSGDSPRSVEGWGSVLQALAAFPGTWADAYRIDAGIDAVTPAPAHAAAPASADQTRVKWL